MPDGLPTLLGLLASFLVGWFVVVVPAYLLGAREDVTAWLALLGALLGGGAYDFWLWRRHRA